MGTLWKRNNNREKIEREIDGGGRMGRERLWGVLGRESVMAVELVRKKSPRSAGADGESS